ncbi:MAG: DNA mismatch repair endonuclease MutL [Elusimicrobiales bacterium]
MIKILDASTYSKIAAGEVIESPVSVLKELIENSLDANANSINITVEKAGKKTIRVNDDGDGMSLEDLKIALYRYSTSKIKNIEDINSLITYGFRGEALFSIFSVSKITINSYDGKGQTGHTLKAEGGDFNSISIFPSAPLKGTTVEVKDLFYNTPARFKFLKSDSYIRSSIIKLIEEFALIRPDKRFVLTVDGKEIYNLPPDKDKRFVLRAKKILGEDLTRDLIYFEENFDKITIKGFVSSSSNLVSSKTFQYIYVNSRIVESKTVSSAVYKAFEHIRLNKHPIFLVSIEAKPSKIDVNVHPQKKEVKFDDENFVYMSVYKTVEKAVENRSSPQRLYDSEPDNELETVKEKDLTQELEKQNISFSQSDFITRMYENEKNTHWYKPPVTFVGQAFASLLIYQTQNSILIIDQHAAAERITFEKYVNEFNEKKISVQKLIIPIELKMPISAISKIMEMKEFLSDAGFEINQIGPNSISVYSVPSLFNFTQKEISEIFNYLNEVISRPSNISAELKRDTIATISCKKSIKFNEKIDSKAALNLIEELKNTKDPLHCPHGRPVMVEISSEELLRKFGRGG